MPTAARRRKRVPTSTIWVAAVGVALFIHGTVLGAADDIGSALTGDGFAATGKPRTVPPVIDLKTSCAGDVLLATSARAALCLAPWRGNAPECSDDLEMTMWMDLSSCRATNEMSTAVAMAIVPQRELEKLTPIDPEPLLEELMQQEKPPQPPQPVPPPQPQTAPPPPPPPPPPPQRRSQVVETVKPSTEQAPDNARFLSEHDIRVEKEKVARGATKEPLVAKSKPEELAIKDKPKDDPSMQKPPEQPPGKNPKAPDVPGTLAMRPPGAPAPSEAPQDSSVRGTKGDKGPIVADGFIPRRGDGAVEQARRDPGELTKGQGGAGGGAPQVPNLKPTKEQLERIVGGGSVDHLEEVESGDETALSAKRWVYASFFNRLKRQVAQNWDPQTVWRRSDPNGNNHGFKTRVTEVRVTLSGKGDLSKIVVTSPSGVNELDDEAVRAFNVSAPFPNPPDGLAKNGVITFAFSFHFEIGAPRTSWRVIRSN